MNIDIQWSYPFKCEDYDGIKKWRRVWLIPLDYCSAFFNFWKGNKYKMWADGFSVKKIDDDWFLMETKLSAENFREIGGKKPAPPPPDPDEFWVPPYKIKDNSILRPWQIEAANKLCGVINKIGSSIDGSEMGIGKTFTACGVARELDVPFLVVCPKTVKNQWKNVIDNHFKIGKKCIGIINYEMLIRGNKDSPIASFIINRKTHRESFRWKIPENSLIVFDEAHRLKNKKTKCSKVAIIAYNQGYKILFLSATIATNPLELKTVGTCLKLFSGNKQYYEWLYSHGVFKGTWGLEFNNDKKSLKQIHNVLFKDKGIRLERDAVPNFPECEIIVESYDLDEESTRKINNIYTDMRVELKKLNETIKKDKNENELVIRLRARQKCEIIKIPLIEDLIEDGISSGMSVVVFLNYSDTIDALAKRLNTKCIFDGRIDEKIRELNKKLFQENKERIMLINNSAGGIGLDLPDLNGNYPRQTIISPDDSAVKIRQVTGRVWRENSKSKSIQTIFFIKGTAEENVMDNVKNKLNNLDILNDGDMKI